jgi:hypothetical protein
MLYRLRVARVTDITRALEDQAWADYKSWKEILRRQNKLRRYVMQYRDLEAQAKVRRERLRRTVPLLDVQLSKSEREFVKDGNEASTEILLPVDEWRENLALWDAMVSILEQVEEMQIVELQHALAKHGRNASRQAIESALRTHAVVFETRSRGREKFAALKK